MTGDLQRLYYRYVEYFTRLENDFARHVGRSVSAAYRPHLLSPDDFCRTWQAWGSFEGVQASWQCRFETGYAAVAKACSERLWEALSCLNDHPSVIPVQPRFLGYVTPQGRLKRSEYPVVMNRLWGACLDPRVVAYASAPSSLGR